MKTVIYHSGDFDGIFCREIAKKFLGDKDVQYIGWDFGDPLPELSSMRGHTIYVLDLNPGDVLVGKACKPMDVRWSDINLIWIDHHKSAIESHPKDIPGYRVDGVAACRLTWAWFQSCEQAGRDAAYDLPTKEQFIDRKVSEPLAVRLAGEYDVWDKRDPDAETFQYGIRSVKLSEDLWNGLLSTDKESECSITSILTAGRYSKEYSKTVDAGNMKSSFLAKWEGLTFLCLNGRGNSLTFASRDIPETGHDALLMFFLNANRQWIVSLYHAKHRIDLDLSEIAVRYGGGGHKGACGFTWRDWPLPF